MEELLVDFADESLTGAEADRVREHIEQCPRCRETVQALRQSLQIAQTIWEDNAQAISRTRARRSYKWRYVAAAAGILLAAGTLAYWPPRQSPSGPSLAEIERQMVEAASAARLLVVAEQLEAQPASRDNAKSQYLYIVEKYPDTAAAQPARLKLQALR